MSGFKVIGYVVNKIGDKFTSSDQDVEIEVSLEKLDDLLEHMEGLRTRVTTLEEHAKIVLAILAVALSVAHCDGDFAPEEQAEIANILTGLLNSDFPLSFQDGIKQLDENPPDFDNAMKYVALLDKQDWPLISKVIDVMVEADGKIVAAEREYLNKWQQFQSK